MKRLGLLFSLTILLCNYKVQAQSRAWTLQECIEYAVENNISIQQSEMQIQTSENTLQQSQWGRWTPNASATITQGANLGRSVDPYTNQFIQTAVYSTNASLGLTLTLFNGFQQTNTIQRNMTSVEVNKLNTEQTKYNTALNVALGYLQVLLNQELLEVAKKQTEVTRAQLERTQKQYDAGAVPIINLTNLQAQLENDELAVVNAENQINLAKLNLMQLMNLSAAEKFDIARVEIGDFEPKAYPQSVDEIYSIAETTQPGIKSADLSVQVSEMSYEISRGGRYPTLSLIGQINTLYSSSAKRFITSTAGTQAQVIGTVDGTGQTVSTLVPVTSRSEQDYGLVNQFADNFSQFVGIRLNIPILGAWQTRTTIRNNQINIENSKLTALNSRIQLRQAIEQAFLNLKAAEKTYIARGEQVKSLQAAYDASEKSFNAGATNAVDFNIAKINLDRAKSDLVRAKYEYIFRTKVLDFYQNKPLTLE
ncbi:MAG: TolC family protein [Cytophagales bacterium]|nr:MAG: TolC family protein [Cytophagales bacterium]